jgi:hypothetical protein
VVGHVARMGSKGMHVGYWWENQKERPRRRWRDRIGCYGRDWSGSGQGQADGSCECANGSLGSINAGKFVSSCATSGF